MKETPRYSVDAVRMARGYFLVGGFIGLCTGGALFLFASSESFSVAVALTVSGIISMLVGFLRNPNGVGDAARDALDE